MLEHNPTPSLDEMVEFTQRFRALSSPTVAEPRPVHVDAVSSSPSDLQLKELFTMFALLYNIQSSVFWDFFAFLKRWSLVWIS